MKLAAIALVTLLGGACVVGEPGEDAVAGDGLDDLDMTGTMSDGVGSIAMRICPNDVTTKGVDVSYYQGDVNWRQVHDAGYMFTFIRLSDGSRFRDPKFQQNWDGAKAAGVIRGAYQFFRPGQDVALQADMMIKAIGTYTPGDLPPVLDVEATSGMSATQVASKVRQWVDTVQRALSVKPIIYTGKYFWRDQVGGNTSFESHALWIAQYTSLCPDIPSPWTRWTFWQHNDHGSVPGIPGIADLNKFNGTPEQLLAFANGTPPARTSALPFTWVRDADAMYTFSVAPAPGVSRIEIRVDDYLIGTSTPNVGKAEIDYTFNAKREARVVEVRGLDAAGAVVAVGNGLIDSTDTPEIYIAQKGESDYEIGLDHVDPSVATVEVTSDGFPLTDSETGRFKSERGATRFAWETPGTRELQVTSRNAQGTILFQDKRTLLVR